MPAQIDDKDFFPDIRATSLSAIRLPSREELAKDEIKQSFKDFPDTSFSPLRWVHKKLIAPIGQRLSQLGNLRRQITEDEENIMRWIHNKIVDIFCLDDIKSTSPQAEFIRYSLGDPKKHPEWRFQPLSLRLAGVVMMSVAATGRMPTWLTMPDIGEDPFWGQVQKICRLIEQNEDVAQFDIAIQRIQERLQGKNPAVLEHLLKIINEKKAFFLKTREELLKSFEQEIQMYPEEIDLLNNIENVLSKSSVEYGKNNEPHILVSERVSCELKKSGSQYIVSIKEPSKRTGEKLREFLLWSHNNQASA